MEPSLDLVGVSYRYPVADTDALHQVDLTFRKGSFTVIMGPAGAGKSTLLMILNGVIPQLKEGILDGQVLLDGADLETYRIQTITRYVGLVLQDAESQILGRTVAEDVSFGPRNYLVPRGEIQHRIGDCLAAVQLTGLEGYDTAQLSGGQKQRLAIAGILALQPQVLCLDEPASELDPQGRTELYRTVDALRSSRDTTIVAVEHTGSDVVCRADRLVVLNHGAVTWQGDPIEFFTDPDLARANQVKPLPVATIGAELVAAGLIQRSEVPLSADAAETLIRRLLAGRALPAPALPAPSRQPGDPVIELHDLVHTYPGGRRGLADVNLSVGRGEYVAVVGRNGAGKTTLVKHLNRLLDPTSGTVGVNGLDAGALEPWELAQHVGYVFQNPDHQIFSTTVAAEVRYGLTLAGLTPADIDTRVEDVLALTGLSAVRDEHPFSLSKGERQRVAVASILALRPAILVLDEPTTGQDCAGVQAMMTLVDRLNADGTTIVMITHDLDLVSHHARRVVVMNDGRITADGVTADVLSRTDILAAAAVHTTQTVDLCLRLWPGVPPLLDEAELGRHLAHELSALVLL
ncbi:MAG: ABC transporter ATP-binding protein [Propionicimonas sp.]